ncbi:MAG TPA: AcvB/VirJ family lysyl-phosphatidylglycerol hydrolase [Steroidobacteraceae bacterium]
MALLAMAGYLVHTRAPRFQDTSQFGRVRIYPAWLRSRGFMYLFSGARGWSRDEEGAAREFAREDYLVVGIDSRQFLDWAGKSPDTCLYLPGLLEDFSRSRQRSIDNSQYLAPVLLGHDLGGTLVYMAQLQSPPTAFNAAVVIDPQDQIALQRAFCDHPAAAATAIGSGQRIRPERLGSNVPTRVLLDAMASADEREFVMAIPGAAPAAVTAGSALHTSYQRSLASIAEERSRSGVGDLPLAEVPATQSPRDAFAVLYSGDGGWRDLDRSLADILAAKGLSVAGVDVLRYFWARKSPAKAAADLARIIRYYQQRWQRRKVVLIGFSFGADVLPLMVNDLPGDLRSDISLITLLAPERRTAFEVVASGWFGVHNGAGMAIAPELLKLSGIHIQCFYGSDEGADSLCTTAEAAKMGVEVVVKPGGHHFDRNYQELADQILAGVP